MSHKALPLIQDHRGLVSYTSSHRSIAKLEIIIPTLYLLSSKAVQPHKSYSCCPHLYLLRKEIYRYRPKSAIFGNKLSLFFRIEGRWGQAIWQTGSISGFNGAQIEMGIFISTSIINSPRLYWCKLSIFVNFTLFFCIFQLWDDFSRKLQVAWSSFCTRWKEEGLLFHFGHFAARSSHVGCTSERA